jgi:hypothetical protein
MWPSNIILMDSNANTNAGLDKERRKSEEQGDWSPEPIEGVGKGQRMVTRKITTNH